MTMGKIEERLFDLEEYLRRNDDSADSSAYLTIVGIANEVSNLESGNAKLREYITRLEQANIVLSSDNCDLLNDMEDMQFFIAENRKLRELLQRLLTEYRYMRTRPRRTYLQHERRMRVIEEEMRSLGIEVE